MKSSPEVSMHSTTAASGITSRYTIEPLEKLKIYDEEASTEYCDKQKDINLERRPNPGHWKSWYGQISNMKEEDVWREDEGHEARKVNSELGHIIESKRKRRHLSGVDTPALPDLSASTKGRRVWLRVQQGISGGKNLKAETTEPMTSNGYR
jgi:hypothetical protein